MDERFVTTKQDTKYHRCGLLGEPWDICNKFIEGGILVNFRRKLKRFTMISIDHPLTKMYAPSMRRLKREEKVHLVQHYDMIHPLSMFSMYFNVISALILMFYFMAIPIIYPLTSKFIFTIMMIPCNVNYVMLWIMGFVVGYYDTFHNMVVMDKGKVAKHYIINYFFYDIIGMCPQIIRILGLRRAVRDATYNIAYPTMIFLMYKGRYPWLLQIIEHTRLYYGWSTFTSKSIKLFFNMVMGLEFAAYILYSFLPDVPPGNVELFLKHCSDTFEMLLLVNVGRCVDHEKIQDIIIPIVFILMGFVFHLAIHVQTMEIVYRYFCAQNNQTNTYNAVNAYMSYKALPVNLRDRIHLYLKFKYQGHFYKDSVIKKATSWALRKEILMAQTKKDVDQVQLFANLSHEVLRKIRTALSSEIFLPGDVIVRAGSPGYCMFLLVAGTVVVTSMDNVEMDYLRDGDHFGEVALALDLNRLANVVAVSPCEFFILDKQRFLSVLSKYPTIIKELQMAAAQYLAEISRRGYRSIDHQI